MLFIAKLISCPKCYIDSTWIKYEIDTCMRPDCVKNQRTKYYSQGILGPELWPVGHNRRVSEEEGALDLWVELFLTKG